MQKNLLCQNPLYIGVQGGGVSAGLRGVTERRKEKEKERKEGMNEMKETMNEREFVFMY